MVNSDWKVQLGVIIDRSSLSEAQKRIAKEKINLNVNLNLENFAKTKIDIQKFINELSTQLKSIDGLKLTDKQSMSIAKDYYKQMRNMAKQLAVENEKSFASDQNKYYSKIIANNKEIYSLKNKILSADKTQTTEINKQIKALEQRNRYNRQKISSNGLTDSSLEKEIRASKTLLENRLKINQAKAQDEEYKLRQKNLSITEKQLEKDRQIASTFANKSSTALSKAINKYSYGDSSEARALMQKMNRGVSNFGNLSNVTGQIKTYSAEVDSVIDKLKLSHQQNLSSLNQEIKTETQLQNQKDSFYSKNLNAIDMEIQKREEESRVFSSSLKAQMESSQLIQSKLNGGSFSDYQTQITLLENKFRKLGLSEDEVKSKMKGVADSFAQLKSSSLENITENNQKFTTSLATATNEAKVLKTQLDEIYNPTRQVNLKNNLLDWLTKNTAATKEAKAQIRSYYAELDSGRASIARINEISSAFSNTNTQMRSMGKLGNSLFTELVNGAKKFTVWTSSTFMVMKAFSYIRNGLRSVKELDGALVDLRKTTSMTQEQLEKFYVSATDVAKKNGVSTKQIIEQASAWSRLGYSSKEAATTMAEISSKFKAISPEMTVDEATDGLVSVMKAFDIAPTDALDGIASKINEIGNTAATSNKEITNMLQKSSSAMKEANNSLEETIALETAAVEITRDDDSVGTAFKTVAMRLRGYDEETESYTNDVENLSGAIADLTKTASTPGGISLFTDASKSEYKSTYQLLEEISKIYDQLSDKQQAGLLEAIAGKRQGQIIAATIDNFSAAEKAMDSMANSAGKADEEMSIITDSVQYKMNTFAETGTEIAQNLFQRDEMKTVIDGLTKLAEAISFVTDKAGLLGSIGLGVGIFAGFKNVGAVKLY